MPLFGNRMVVATANYKHIKDKKKEIFDRETRLGRWVSERKERKEKLEDLQEKIRQSTNSINEDGPEVALEEPHHPEINSQTNSSPANQIPDTHFIVEESEEILEASRHRNNPCSQCLIQ